METSLRIFPNFPVSSTDSFPFSLACRATWAYYFAYVSHPLDCTLPGEKDFVLLDFRHSV